MTAEARKSHSATKTQRRKAEPSLPRGMKALGPFSTREAAIQAIQSLDDGFVSLTVNLEPKRSRIFTKQAGSPASPPPTIVAKKNSGKLTPNDCLIEALREGQKLKGRFSSAEELFHALESEK